MSSPTERTPLLRGSNSDSQPSGSVSKAPTVVSLEQSLSKKLSSESVSQRAVDDDGESAQSDVGSTDDFDFWPTAIKVAPLVVGMLLSAMEFTFTISASAPIGSDLKGLQSASWITTGYMLALASFQPLYGKLSDIFGRKSCMLFAYSIFALGTLACGLARSMPELIAARIFTGIGGGGISTLGSIIMSDIIPLRLRGTWQGIGNSVWALGMGIGAPLGGFLADTIGWRWAFLFQVPVALLAVTSVSLCLKIPTPEEAHWRSRLKRIDFAGAFSLVVALISLLSGLDRGGNVAWDDRLTIASLAVFATFAITFGYVEARVAKEPFAPQRIVANGALMASYICNFFATAAAVSLLFYSSLYVQAVESRSSAGAGLATFPYTVGVVAGSLYAGVIMQLTGRYYILTIVSYFVMLAGTIVMTLSVGIIGHSFIGLEIGMLLMSFMFHGGITTTLISLLALADTQDTAVVVAASYLFRSLGSVLGLSIGSTIFQYRLRYLLSIRLTGHDIDELVRRVRETLSYIDKLDPTAQTIVRSSYGEALQATFWYCVAATAAATFSSFFIKEKHLSRKPN